MNLSSAMLSRLFHSLGEEFESWKSRPLQSHYLYVFADSTYFTVICGDEGCKMPILAVAGIGETGKREVPAFSVGETGEPTHLRTPALYPANAASSTKWTTCFAKKLLAMTAMGDFKKSAILDYYPV